MAPIDCGLIRSSRARSEDVAGPVRSSRANADVSEAVKSSPSPALVWRESLHEEAHRGLHGTGYLVNGRLYVVDHFSKSILIS